MTPTTETPAKGTETIEKKARTPEQVQLEKDIAYAKSMQKRRLAPDVLAADTSVVGEDAKMIQLLRDTGSIPRGMHEFIGDVRKHRVYLSQGYQPVVDENSGEQVHAAGGDPVYMIDDKIHQHNLRIASARDAAMLRTTPPKVAEVNKEMGDGGKMTDDENTRKTVSPEELLKG